MEENQDLFEKLRQIRDSYDPDPDLANRVIEKINQREATVAFKKPVPKWIWYLIGGLIAAFLAVFLPVYLTRNSKLVIYSSENIIFEDISNMDGFLSENNLNFKYFKTEPENDRLAKIKDNGIYAYITQEFTGIGENGFDVVVLNVVLMKNAEFEFYNSFNSLNEKTVINKININYSIYNSINDNSSNILAKFVLKGKTYFLEIDTQYDGTAVLEKYINQLLN